MRILHVSTVYAPYKAGIANVVKEEATRLARRGHDIHVATLGEKNEKEVLDGVTVHRIKPGIRWGKAGLAFGILKLARREGWDAIHLHLPFFGISELFAVAMWFRWKPALVVTYHMDISMGGVKGLIAQVYRRLFLPTLRNRARHVCVASHDYARESWLADNWQKVKEKIRILPFGIDTVRFAPVDHDHEHVQLLFVGAMDAQHYFKGVDVLLEALKKLEGNGDWRLTLVGDGDLRPKYEIKTRELGLEDRVSFAGRVTDEDLPSYYAHASIFVFPSVDRSEAFGLVALEAQASGVPVVASDLDGVRTVVEHGATGLLVEPKNVEALAAGIETLMGDSVRREEMGQAARRRVKKTYAWDTHIGTLEGLYSRHL